MRKWLDDRPWIWIVLFLGALVLGSIITVIIAELNKPQIVRPRRAQHAAPGHGGVKIDGSAIIFSAGNNLSPTSS